VLARGHVLLEDVPGTGKTLTARTLANALGLSFSRIQFTPDLLPTDVTGTHVFNEQTREFEYSEGPIFANIVLADEINRAPPKTQAALLEAMEEEQVTTDGDTHRLPHPFFVIATQNPVEQEGSLHPDETVYVDGQLRTARDALQYAKEAGELVHDGTDTRMYDVDVTTQSLQPDGTLERRAAMVYETEYDGRIYTVRTRTGREIRVSGNHPFLVNRAGAIRWVDARDLGEDDHLVAPDRLESADQPFPTHDEALATLEDDCTVVSRETVEGIRDALAERAELSRSELNALRIAKGLSKRDLADRVGASDDRVCNYFQGADNGVGSAILDALRGTDLPEPADYVESYRTHRFERELTDEEAGFFLGFVLSDGHHTDSWIAIYQSNYPDAFDRWVDIAREIGARVRIRDLDGGREARIDSKPLVQYLDARYGLDDPMALLGAPEEFRRAFLEIFLLAESHFDADRRRITFTQKDRDLTNLVAHLLLQFEVRPWIEDRGRVYRIKIQGEDVATYLEHFEWPGDAPDVDTFDSVHRTTPVDADDLETIVESLGIDRDGEFSSRDWYQSFRMARSGKHRMNDAFLEAFLDDVEGELRQREATDVRTQAAEDLATAARQSGLAITDVAEGAGTTKHAIWSAYEGGPSPPEAIEFVTDVRNDRVEHARKHTKRLRRLVSGDVFYDEIEHIESEPYDGPVIGLSVPETHNYLGGLGACGINHNTFPLPEAQIDRFMVKTSLGYPDEEGEIELLRRRAGRTEQSPSIERVVTDEIVTELRSVPETVRVDEDLMRYIAQIARRTRQHSQVKIGVSPRGTQRLFESARARATLVGREYVTPDDIKRIAQPVLAHRLVLTPDATVSAVEKSEIIEAVLEDVPVPTID
jgi:MoxR-like ATPase/intein/homing endonuclease